MTTAEAPIASTVRLSKGGQIEIAQVPVPELRDDEILIRTECSNISVGTEVAWIEQARKQNQSMALGYSNVGIIERIGAAVRDYRVGQRVLSGLPHASYGICRPDSKSVTPVLDGLSPEKATLAILGSVASHVVERAAPRLFEPTAVIGQGIVGSFILQLLRICGAMPLVAIDAEESRLMAAQKAGIHTINASRENVAERVKQITDGKGVSLCIEAAGSPKVIATAPKLLALRGRLVISSTLYEPVPFDILEDFIEREMTVIGAHTPKCPGEPNPYYPWTTRMNRLGVMQSVHDKRMSVDHLISHVVRPSDVPQIYERLLRRDRSIVGVVIDWR